MLLKLDFANYFSNFVSRMLFIGLENCNAPGVFIGINTVIYNAITQNNWFVIRKHMSTDQIKTVFQFLFNAT